MTITQNFVRAATKLITRNPAFSREDAVVAGQVVGWLYAQTPVISVNPLTDPEVTSMIRQGIDRFTRDPAKIELIRSTLSEAYDIACDPARFARLMEPHRSVG